MRIDKRLGEAAIPPMIAVSDQLVVAATGFLVSVFVARMAGPAGLGVYAATYVVVMALRSCQQALILQPMSVFGPRLAGVERREYLGFLSLAEAGGVAALSALMALGAILLQAAGLLGQPYATAVLAGILYGNALGLQDLIRRQFYVDQVPGRALRQSAAFLVLASAALGGLFLRATPSIPAVYVALTAASLLVCLVQSWGFRNAVGWPGRARIRDFTTRHLGLGSWVLLTVPFAILSYQGYFLLTSILLSSEATGLVKAVDALIAPFDQIGIGVTLLLVPRLAGRIDSLDTRARAAWVAKVSATILSVAAVYVLVVLVAGPRVLPLVFGAETAAAVALVPVMAALPFCKAAAYAPGMVLLAVKQTKLTFLAYLAASLGTVLVGIPLIQAYGVRGAAWGFVVSVSFQAAGLWLGFLWNERRERRSATEEAPRGEAPAVLVVGPLPPPTHGMALVTKAVAAQLGNRGVVADVSPGSLSRGVRYHARKSLRVLRAIGMLVRGAFHDRRRLYVAADARWGLIYTTGLVLVARLFGCAVFIHHHSFAYVRRWDVRMALLTRIAGRNAHHVLLSPRMAERFRRRYPGGSLTHVLSNAGFVAAGAAPHEHRESFCVGHLSNLSREKGLDLVLATFRRLHQRHPAARLVLAGPPVTAEDEAMLDRARRELGGAVECWGHVDESGKRRFYETIDVFLFPTRYENEAEPLVVLEALSCGVPVLAFGRGCIEEMLAEGASRAFPPESDYVREALPWLLQWAEEHDALKDASADARRRFEELRSLATRQLDTIEQLLTGESRRRADATGSAACE